MPNLLVGLCWVLFVSFISGSLVVYCAEFMLLYSESGTLALDYCHDIEHNILLCWCWFHRFQIYWREWRIHLAQFFSPNLIIYRYLIRVVFICASARASL